MSSDRYVIFCYIILLFIEWNYENGNKWKFNSKNNMIRPTWDIARTLVILQTNLFKEILESSANKCALTTLYKEETPLQYNKDTCAVKH